LHFFYLANFDIEAQAGPQAAFEIFGIPVNDTTLIGYGITIGLIIFARLLTRNLEIVPGRLQNAMEMLLESIMDITEGMMAGGGRKMLPFIGTIALFIGLSNIIGVLPLLKNPTADLNMTLAFGLSVFIFSNAYAIKNKGLGGYVKGFFEPMAFMLPINLLGELAKPISHSFRLFGNVFGGSVLIALAAYFVPGILPVPLMAWFDIFIGLVQALIFTMLAIAYISIASE